MNKHIKKHEQHFSCVCVCVCVRVRVRVRRVPFLMVGGLLISGERTDTIDSAFFYGRAQVVTLSSAEVCLFLFKSVIVLSSSTCFTAIFLYFYINLSLSDFKTK